MDITDAQCVRVRHDDYRQIGLPVNIAGEGMIGRIFEVIHEAFVDVGFRATCRDNLNDGMWRTSIEIRDENAILDDE